MTEKMTEEKITIAKTNTYPIIKKAIDEFCTENNLEREDVIKYICDIFRNPYEWSTKLLKFGLCWQGGSFEIIYTNKKFLVKENRVMGNTEFVKRATKAVTDYFNEKHSLELTEDDVYVVWMCKTLQNNKALLSTNVLDGMYYEVTYNGDKNEMYLDAYKKWDNKCIKIEDQIKL